MRLHIFHATDAAATEYKEGGQWGGRGDEGGEQKGEKRIRTF